MCEDYLLQELKILITKVTTWFIYASNLNYKDFFLKEDKNRLEGGNSNHLIPVVPHIKCFL